MPLKLLFTDGVLILESLSADLGGLCLLRAGSSAIAVLLCSNIVVSLWTYVGSTATKGGKLLLRSEVLVLILELCL